MANFTIQIDAPALSQAISELAKAIMGSKAGNRERPQPMPGSAMQSALPVQAAPAPSVPVQQPPAVPTAPVQAAPTAGQKDYTIEELQAAAGELVRAQKQAELLALLQKYGAPAVTALTQAQYGAFATDLRQLGAHI